MSKEENKENKKLGADREKMAEVSLEVIGSRKISEMFFEKQIACEWLSTEEAAHFLSVSANALRIMVYRNQVPVFKFGRRLRFRFRDCQALFVTKGP